MSDQPTHKAAKAPVSAHPAFPAIVALWFAALLGLGSMVLPIALFEGLSEASGASSVMAAAQPPLGVTARIVIALAAGGIGIVLGIAIARRIVAANAPKPVLRRSATAKRPISAHEELGDRGLDACDDDDAPHGPIPGRRRALSVTDDSARSEFLDHAPVPGQAAPDASEVAHNAEPLDLAAFDAETAIDPIAVGDQEDIAMREAAAEPDPWAEPAAFGSATLSEPPLADELTFRPAEQADDGVQPSVVVASPAGASAGASPTERPLAGLAMAELVERFARALESHRAEPASVSNATRIEAGPVLDVTFAFAAKPPPTAESPPPAFAAISDENLPAALRPLGFEDTTDEAGEDEIDLGLTLAATPAERSFAVPVAEIEADDDAEETAGEELDEGSYSSLLAMRGPADLPREPVRVDDDDDETDGLVEPVVVFPGQMRRSDSPARNFGFGGAGRPFDAPAARAEAAMAAYTPAPPPIPAQSADTERALRDALEKLQKMSGAA